MMRVFVSAIDPTGSTAFIPSLSSYVTTNARELGAVYMTVALLADQLSLKAARHEKALTLGSSSHIHEGTYGINLHIIHVRTPFSP